MPTLSRSFIKGGLLCLAVGMTAGGLLLASKGTGYLPGLWVLLPAHVYLVLIGGLSQCALGVSYWIFPRQQRVRRHGLLAWLSYLALNTALLLVVCHVPVQLLLGPWAASRAFISAGVLQGLAAVTFVLHIWPRIRAAESTARQRQSESG